MQATVNIEGHCDPRFRALEDAFRENFERFGEVGASVAILVDGEAVVDLWGGHMDAARTKAWERDTIVNVWSTTKGITGTCIPPRGPGPAGHRCRGREVLARVRAGG
jgi:CubicO group peptidase (beta-lactamase class C family)